MTADGAKHVANEPARMRLLGLMAILPVAAVTLVALVWLWPTGDYKSGRESSVAEVEGQITATRSQECAEDLPDNVNGCGTATVRLDDQTEIQVELPNGSGAPRVAEGDAVILTQNDGPDGAAYTIVDHQRGTQLWLLAGTLALALIAFGRWRGFTALVGLAVTFGVLFLFVAPAILAGEAPLLVAIVGASSIMLTVLYLTHGFALSTTVALIGTLISFALTGLLSAAAVAALHLTGVTDDISMAVETAHQVDMQGLLLAGIVIGSLGVLDDVTVTQAVTVSELARANPQYRARQLYVAASRVGRSHIASVVNTIILAYAGASLPLLILTVADNNSFGGVVTDQFIAQEIVRSVVATLGLIAAVPVTTGLAALAMGRVRSGRGRPATPASPRG